MPRSKENLKSCGVEGDIAFIGATIRLADDFSTKVKEFIRQWNNILKVLKENNYQSKILYPVEMSFINEIDL